MITAQQPQALGADDAYAVVQRRVYNPVFFEKMANAGFTPRNVDEANTMLVMASQLRVAHDKQASAKQANARNFLDAANSHLQAQLQSQGMQTVNNIQAEAYVKQAAAHCSFDPEIAHAILSLQVAGSAQQ